MEELGVVREGDELDPPEWGQDAGKLVSPAPAQEDAGDGEVEMVEDGSKVNCGLGDQHSLASGLGRKKRTHGPRSSS